MAKKSKDVTGTGASAWVSSRCDAVRVENGRKDRVMASLSTRDIGMLKVITTVASWLERDSWVSGVITNHEWGRTGQILGIQNHFAKWQYFGHPLLNAALAVSA